MGGFLSKLFRQELKLLVLGLEGAGKTTTLCNLRLGEFTIERGADGLDSERVVCWKGRTKISFIMWNVGSPSRDRTLWKQHLNHTHGLIFVVDCNDRDRLPEARDELHRLANEDELQGVPLLVFANKQDLPNAMSAAEITDALGLNSLPEGQWHVEGTIAGNRAGVYEGLDWLASEVTAKASGR